MAELTPRERLLPSLLDRLTDEKPERIEESRERRAVSTVDLRRSVLRDLEWLLNTVNLESSGGLATHPELGGTVINFGMPALAGSTLNATGLAAIRDRIHRAVLDFEPRILEGSLRVRTPERENASEVHSVAFEIEGLLWCRPMPEALYLRTELDLELGDVRISEL